MECEIEGECLGELRGIYTRLRVRVCGTKSTGLEKALGARNGAALCQHRL